MTTTTPPGYRWNAGTIPLPFDASRFKGNGVIGEIKPHNKDGIAAGIAQLRTRPGISRRKARLVTYRQVPGQPSRYEVLAADPMQVKSVLRGDRQSIDRWYTLGVVESARAAQPMPRWQCPTVLGSLLEQQIRRRYAVRVGATLHSKNGPHSVGADIEHELLEMAEFLRELAAELEAEAGY